jgi:hypothetical protein
MTPDVVDGVRLIVHEIIRILRFYFEQIPGFIVKYTKLQPRTVPSPAESFPLAGCDVV